MMCSAGVVFVQVGEMSKDARVSAGGAQPPLAEAEQAAVWQCSVLQRVSRVYKGSR